MHSQSARTDDVSRQIVRIPEPMASGKNTIPSIDHTDQQDEKPRRLLALDAFRGLTIALMLLVNNIALDSETPRQLMHAPWNEMIRLADLVFPWFLFCAGIAIPYAAASFRKKSLPMWRYDIKVLLRTSVLVLLGCLLESSFAHQLTFSLGVLQIIGLAYLTGAFLYDLPVFRRLLILCGVLVSYWLAIKFIPVPGIGVGVFEERQNLIWFINQNFFGSVRFWGHAFSLWGLPSVVPTSALVLLGTVIGDVLRATEVASFRKVLALGAIGVTLTAAGFLWNNSLAFSKAFWTPSYILVCAGTGTLFLSALYLLLDMLSIQKIWAYPLLVFGANALLAYVAPILVKVLILEDWHIGPNLSIEQWGLTTFTNAFGHIIGGWCYTLAYILIWWVALWQFYRKKIFIRV